MEKKFNLRRIIGILLVALSLGAISFWELWGRVNMTYDSVAVLKSSVSAHTVIHGDMIRERKVDHAAEGAVLYQNRETLVGLESVQFIPKGAELHSEYFEESTFSIGGDTGKFIMSLPAGWVEAYPQTVKRGDEVLLFGSGEHLTSCIVAHVRDSSNQEVTYDNERLSSSAVVELIEIIVDDKQADKIMSYVHSGDGQRIVIMYD